MDIAQIAELRAWAGRLAARTDHEELRAAGKAIAMLLDEVEELQSRLAVAEADELQSRLVVAEADAPPPARFDPFEKPAPVAAAPVEEEEGSLRGRLKRTLGFD